MLTVLAEGDIRPCQLGLREKSIYGFGFGVRNLLEPHEPCARHLNAMSIFNIQLVNHSRLLPCFLLEHVFSDR